MDTLSECHANKAVEAGVHTSYVHSRINNYGTGHRSTAYGILCGNVMQILLVNIGTFGTKSPISVHQLCMLLELLSDLVSRNGQNQWTSDFLQ